MFMCGVWSPTLPSTKRQSCYVTMFSVLFLRLTTTLVNSVSIDGNHSGDYSEGVVREWPIYIDLGKNLMLDCACTWCVLLQRQSEETPRRQKRQTTKWRKRWKSGWSSLQRETVAVASAATAEDKDVKEGHPSCPMNRPPTMMTDVVSETSFYTGHLSET